MTPERHRRVGELYHAALGRDPEERAAFLDRECAADRELQREVESLIALQERAGDFLAAPALGVAAGLLARDEADALAGRTLGHYRVLSLVGAGGMGRVYLAEDAELGRRVALKFLPEHLTHDKNQVRRFRQEARAASALNHPNILTVHEVGEADGAEFIATEFVEGETLRARLQRGPLSVREALDVAAQVADALVAAHRAGIAHRDIKPENVMLRADGYVKVLDFGLAKLTQSTEGQRSVEPEAPTKSKVMTEPGVVMGTPHYMSPEQARGLAVDARTDIWSLGVVLYEMVAARPPFEGATPTDVIVSILEREPPPLALHMPEASAELERIVRKALVKGADERYRTIKDMATDLRRLRRRLEVEAEIERSVPPASGDVATAGVSSGGGLAAAGTDAQAAARASEAGAARTTSSIEYVVGEIKKHKRGAALLSVAVIILLGGVNYGVYKILRQPKPFVVPFQRRVVARLTATGKAKSAAISPDGKYVAYIEEDDNQQSMWVKQVATGSSVQILPPVEFGIWSVNFSRDGHHIFYTAENALYRLPVLGGTPIKVFQNIGGGERNNFSFSPDGKQFAFLRTLTANESAIFMANTDGTGERMLATSKRPNVLLGSPAWSPDGKVIACVAMTVAGFQEVVTVRIADGVVSSIPSPKWLNVWQVAWQPGADSLLVIAGERDDVGRQIWQLSYPAGEARKITDDPYDYQSISLTADGSGLVAARLEQEAHIWVTAGEDASQAKQVTSGSEKFDGTEGLNWLINGKIIYTSAPSGKDEVWMIDADGRNPRQIAVDAASDSSSPDGSHLVFQTEENKVYGLFRLNLSDGEKKRLTTGADIDPTFSPTGQWIVFTRYDEQVALWKVPFDGGEATKITNISGYTLGPAVSPDGKLVAFFWGQTDRGKTSPKIALVPFEGGEVSRTFLMQTPHTNWRVFVSENNFKVVLQWTADGRAINYVAHHDGVSNIFRQPIDAGPPAQVTNFRDGRIFNFAYSPDGKKLALSRGTLNRDVVLISDFR